MARLDDLFTRSDVTRHGKSTTRPTDRPTDLSPERRPKGKGPATRNDIVDIVDDRSSTMVFNVAKIASARASSTISLTKSLRVAGPLMP